MKFNGPQENGEHWTYGLVSSKDLQNWKDCSGNSGNEPIPLSAVNDFYYMQDTDTYKCVLNHQWDIDPPVYNIQPSSNPALNRNADYVPSNVSA